MTEGERAVLERGECILFLDLKSPVDVDYRTWSRLIDKGWITYKRSNLDAKRPWERYRITPAGRRALEEGTGG